jgi:hypothetical protein
MMRHSLLALSGVIIAMGCAAPAIADSSEETMARCEQLYGLWTKHNGTSGYGRVLDADMALEQCRKGDYAAGVAQMKRVLERQQIPVPAVESAATR